MFRSTAGLRAASVAAAAMVAIAMASGGMAQGSGPVQAVAGPAKQLTLTVGQGELFRTVAPFAKVSVTDEKIVDVTPQSDQEFVVNPKAVGSTDVFVLDARNGLMARLDVTVVKSFTHQQARTEGPKSDGLVRIYSKIYDDKGNVVVPTVYNCDERGCEGVSDASDTHTAGAPAGPTNADAKDASPK